MSDLPLLDTNVFLRHLRNDHPTHSPRATALFSRIERGELRARTAITAIFETVFTLERFYRHPRFLIRDAVLPLLDLPGLVLPEKRYLPATFRHYVDDNLSFADSYHAALVRHLGLPAIVSFDRGYDRIPGLRRIEP